MFSFLFGLVKKIFFWTVEAIVSATVEAIIF